MPSIRLIDIEINSDDPQALVELFRTAMASVAIPSNALRLSTSLDVPGGGDVSEYETILATQAPAAGAPGPSAAEPAPESDPDLRDRQRKAAANAREALAAQRKAKADAAAQEAAEKAAKTAAAKPATRAAKPASAAPSPASTSPATPTVEDLSGDDEDGDLERSPDTEPTDYGVGAGAGEPANGNHPASVGSLTPEQQREECLLALHAIADTNAPGVLDAVKKHVRSFGGPKVADVPLARMAEFWTKTAALCATYSVPFPTSPATH